MNWAIQDMGKKREEFKLNIPPHPQKKTHIQKTKKCHKKIHIINNILVYVPTKTRQYKSKTH